MSNEEWYKHVQDKYIQRMEGMQQAQSNAFPTYSGEVLGVSGFEGAMNANSDAYRQYQQKQQAQMAERLRMEAELRQKQHEYEMRKFEEELKRVADAREYREMIGWLQAAYPEVLGQWHAAKALIRSAEAMDHMGGVANEAVQQGHAGTV